MHENIEAFGGDPGNVMIFGESGGGAKTSCLYAMPAVAPFLHKASIESGPGIRMMPRDSAAETTLMTLKQLLAPPVTEVRQDKAMDRDLAHAYAVWELSPPTSEALLKSRYKVSFRQECMNESRLALFRRQCPTRVACDSSKATNGRVLAPAP